MCDTEQTAVRGGGIRLPLWLIRPVINELPQGESKLGVGGYQIGADTSEREKCSTYSSGAGTCLSCPCGLFGYRLLLTVLPKSAAAVFFLRFRAPKFAGKSRPSPPSGLPENVGVGPHGTSAEGRCGGEEGWLDRPPGDNACPRGNQQGTARPIHCLVNMELAAAVA